MTTTTPTSTQNLPLLPLDDMVVLPGMAVPLDLSDAEARVAVEAARGAGGERGRLLLAPRLQGRYAAVGTVAVVDQVGRLPGGEPVAVVSGVARARIGAGTTGDGGALWVDATPVEDTPIGERARELAGEYKGLVVSILQQRGAWQVIDGV